jgi:hypothetical protein
MVRVSFGAYNTRDDVDALVEALTRIRRGDHACYERGADGEYAPAGGADQNALRIPVRTDERVPSGASFT